MSCPYCLAQMQNQLRGPTPLDNVLGQLFGAPLANVFTQRRAASEIPYNVHLERWQTEPPDPYRDNLERFGKGGFGS